MEVLEGIVIFILAAYAFFIIAPPIILDIIWIKRVKSGKRSSYMSIRRHGTTYILWSSTRITKVSLKRTACSNTIW